MSECALTRYNYWCDWECCVCVFIPSVTLRCQLLEDQHLYLTCPEVRGQQQQSKGRVREVTVILSETSFETAHIGLVGLSTQAA